MKMKPLLFDIDLTKIDGEGDFPCPKCEVKISPEDLSEKVYVIVETKVRNNELVELIIQCKNCESKIRLFGWT